MSTMTTRDTGSREAGPTMQGETGPTCDMIEDDLVQVLKITLSPPKKGGINIQLPDHILKLPPVDSRAP